jgi:hypothetical protein
VYDSVAREGVTSHVELAWDPGEERPMIPNGHHRLAAARAVERDTGRNLYVPTHNIDMGHPDRFLDAPEELYPQNVRKDWKGGT